MTKVSELPVDVLNKDVVSALRENFPNVTTVHLARNVTSNGINYRNGMLLAHALTGGYPDFGEILEMCVVQNKL